MYLFQFVTLLNTGYKDNKTVDEKLESFGKLDINGDGFLSLDELIEFYKQILQNFGRQDLISTALESTDFTTNGNMYELSKIDSQKANKL